MRSNLGKKVTSVILCTAMALSATSAGKVQAQETKEMVENPRVESANGSGQIVTWDCIYFGSYPQSEVTTGDAVYVTLSQADDWDGKGDLVIDGVKYRRLNKSQAVSGKGYPWEDDTTYHYFRYEPVKWRVLETDGSTALLLSDQAIDNQRFNQSYEFMSWDKSTLRSWLNGYGPEENTNKRDYTVNNFIDSAFSTEEQQAIVTSQVNNEDNYVYGGMSGNVTEDKIFLLSQSEVSGKQSVSYGFVQNMGQRDEALRCQATTYANAMGTKNTNGGYYDGNCIWWLRTPGKERFGMYVEPSGQLNKTGYVVNSKNYGVRTAICLNLSEKSLYDYAGRIDSDGQVTTPEAGENVQLSNPIIEKKGKPLVSQQMVTWDTVSFGSYPQTEIATTEAVYACLTASEQWDVNDDVVIDGQKYHRMRKEDATYSKRYRSYEDYLKQPNYYYWSDRETYHYFVYEPVQWRVLQVTDGQMLLLSQQVLDNRIFSANSGRMSWEESDLRSWLNGGSMYSERSFLDHAFTKEEQDAIVINSGGDKLFLLGEEEIYNKAYGFISYSDLADEGRRCAGSDYAKAMGVYVSADEEYRGNACWLMRSPGSTKEHVAGVRFDGIVNTYGVSPQDFAVNYGVRVGLILDGSCTKVYTLGNAMNSEDSVYIKQQEQEGETVPAGDMDGDGKVSLADARLILRAALKLDVTDAEKWSVADVDGDGEITLQDAKAALLVALKITESS